MERCDMLIFHYLHNIQLYMMLLLHPLVRSVKLVSRSIFGPPEVSMDGAARSVDFSVTASLAGASPYLQEARQLVAPLAMSKTHGELEFASFWEQHKAILTKAWAEWPKRHSLLYSADAPEFAARYVGHEYQAAIRTLRVRDNGGSQSVATGTLRAMYMLM